MTIISTLFASTALAVAFFSAAPQQVNALVASNEMGHLAARHLAVSPSHQALGKRKRNTHQNRKRCIQRPVDNGTANPPPPPPPTGDNQTPPPAQNPPPSNNNPPPPPPPANNPPPPPPPSGNHNGKKLGLAWPNGDVPEFLNFAKSNVGYYYTWSPWNVRSEYTNGVKHAPMLWGWHQIGDFVNLVKPGYADVVLGPNEVNEPSQSFMDIYAGRDIWNQYIAPLRYQGYRLGSPATTSAPSGLQWIKDWLPLVNEKPDFICVHWYDVGFQNFQQYVQNFHDQTGGYNIWVTEFACQNFNGGAQCNEGQIYDFVGQATAWMDATDWIEAYFPFGFMRDMQNVNDLNRLMEYNGQPTALGYFFLND